MKTNILVLITLFFTLSFSTKSHAVPNIKLNPHCMETDGGYVTKVVFNLILSNNGLPYYLLNLYQAGQIVFQAPITVNDPNYPLPNVTVDVSSYNIQYDSSNCYAWEIIDNVSGNVIYGSVNSTASDQAPEFCNLECALPCFLETNDEYYGCNGDYPTICPINANANTQWMYYPPGGQVAGSFTADCHTPTGPGSYVLTNYDDCPSTASFTVIDTCAPCNADFEIQIFNQGNGMFGITPLLIDPSVSFVYIEILQGTTIIAQDSMPSSYALSGGAYRICIVARNNWTGEECQSCQDFCIGETTDFDWDGIERAREWKNGSSESSIGDKNQADAMKGNQLEENLKPIITPNPSNGTFIISSLNTKVGMTAIEVYDMSSKLVYSLNSVQNQSRISVDLKEHQSGIYIVKVLYSDGSVRQQKVVVEK